MGGKNGRHRNVKIVRKHAQPKTRKGPSRAPREKKPKESLDGSEEINGQGLLERHVLSPSFLGSLLKLDPEHFLLFLACALEAVLVCAYLSA